MFRADNDGFRPEWIRSVPNGCSPASILTGVGAPGFWITTANGEALATPLILVSCALPPRSRLLEVHDTKRGPGTPQPWKGVATLIHMDSI